MKSIPVNVVRAIREHCRLYLPELSEAEIHRRLTAESPLLAGPEIEPKYVSIQRAAQWLDVCTATIHNMLAAGELPRVKVRRRTVIPVSALEALAVQAPKETAPGTASNT